MLLIGNTLPEKCKNALIRLGYETALLPPFSKLAGPVSSHYDMLIFETKNGYVVHRAYYEENKEFFDARGLQLVLSDEYFSDKYPSDVLFNALDIGNGVLIANEKHISECIKREYEKIINVRQGYARCSTARVGNGYITADQGIYSALVSEGREALLIESGGIVLPGYGHGFIGGASIVLNKRETAFFGDITAHPSYPEMKSFAEKLGAALVSLSEETLFDCGGGVQIVDKTE